LANHAAAAAGTRILAPSRALIPFFLLMLTLYP
jgi:hypothetical protein